MQAEKPFEALQSQLKTVAFLYFCKCIYVSIGAKNLGVSVQLLINLLVIVIKQSVLPDLSFGAAWNGHVHNGTGISHVM